MRLEDLSAQERLSLEALGERVGQRYLRQRLGLEGEHESRVFRRGTHFFHLENWYSVHGLIRGCLRLVGLLERGRRNVFDWRVREHEVLLPGLPAAFDGLTLLQLSDLHLDMNPQFAPRLIERLQDLRYDLCVLTGDYRLRTFGTSEGALAALAELRAHLREPVYGVLGNHDSIRMVPAMERCGIRVLLNESVRLERQGQWLHLAGIDDAHYFRTHNFHQALQEVPHGACTVLLSHTPEPYRQAAHLDVELMLCGHTHGGQICLPGGVPILTDADCPRALARGPWRHGALRGYTSVGAGASIVDVRLNCPPEITLHRLLAQRPAQ